MISQNKSQLKELLLPDYELIEMNEQELVIHHAKSKKLLQKNWFDRLSGIVSIAMLVSIVVAFLYVPDNLEKYSLDFFFLFVCGIMLLFKKFFLNSVKGRFICSFCLSYLCIVSLIIHVGGEKPEGAFLFLFCAYFALIFGMLCFFSASFPVGIAIKKDKVEILERKPISGLYKKSYMITEFNCEVIRNYKYVTKHCYLNGKTAENKKIALLAILGLCYEELERRGTKILHFFRDYIDVPIHGNEETKVVMELQNKSQQKTKEWDINGEINYLCHKEQDDVELVIVEKTEKWRIAEKNPSLYKELCDYNSLIGFADTVKTRLFGAFLMLICVFFSYTSLIGLGFIGVRGGEFVKIVWILNIFVFYVFFDYLRQKKMKKRWEEKHKTFFDNFSDDELLLFIAESKTDNKLGNYHEYLLDLYLQKKVC